MNEQSSSMPAIISLVGLVVGLIVGYLITSVTGKKLVSAKIIEAEAKAKSLISDGEKAADNLLKERKLEIKEEWHKKKQDFETNTESKRSQLSLQEKNVKSREDAVEQKLETILKKEKSLHNFEQDLQLKEKKVNELLQNAQEAYDEQAKKLEKMAGLSRDEAKKQLIEDLVNVAKTDAAQKLNQIREDTKLKANREAQNIIVQAIQRTASDHSVETTVSVMNLASDEMKGRIIGREGRNIRAFEAATGIDLIIDDTPEAVIISGFDPYRRQVAKMALEKLMADGRIHPTRIEEVVHKAEKELEEEMIRTGEATLLELGIHNMRPELIRFIGKMKYRSSYGQNLLNHSIETAYICGIMAVELGLDVNLSKRAALLHDIGKCVDRDIEGPHALLGMELAKKNRENPIVCNAIGAHHEDIEMESAIAVIVQAADSISGARPGARRESLENYIKRLEKLEEIANSWDGVSKTFAIQAGREIRVIVEPEKINDQYADEIADSIAKRIENEMEYPGQITVTVIRERRSVSIAK
ncbi:MAG: ribonuclease Y [Candidatus Kapabacteria bacterium]|nr:ribonuclease Y [Candidatus Kapabacteria bacterium]